MSFFDDQLILSPINRNDQYLPLYQWSSLVGVHYLEALQIIQREAPWAIIYIVVNDHATVRTNHRSEGTHGVSFRNTQSPFGSYEPISPFGSYEPISPFGSYEPISPNGYCEPLIDLESECCKTNSISHCEARRADSINTPECFKLNYTELGLDEGPDFNRIFIFYDRQSGLVNHVPVRG